MKMWLFNIPVDMKFSPSCFILFCLCAGNSVASGPLVPVTAFDVANVPPGDKLSLRIDADPISNSRWSIEPDARFILSTGNQVQRGESTKHRKYKCPFEPRSNQRNLKIPHLLLLPTKTFAFLSTHTTRILSLFS